MHGDAIEDAVDMGRDTGSRHGIGDAGDIIDGTSSDPSVVTSGVPQGTVLAPLLFLCFVNDIPLNVTSKIKLYADDILLYRTCNKFSS